MHSEMVIRFNMKAFFSTSRIPRPACKIVSESAQKATRQKRFVAALE